MHAKRAPLIALSLVAGALASLTALDRAPAPARAQASKLASACTVKIDEAATDPLPDCRTGAVSVTLAVTCPPVLPFHAVFVVARHLLMEDHLDDVKKAAREAANALDFTPVTQAAVVSLSVQERVEQDMTDKKGSVTAAIGQIQLDDVNPTLNYYDWLGRAGRMLERARETAPAPPLEAVILYSTGCPTGFESYCNRQAAAANQLKGQGITVIGVCHPGARPFGIPLPGNHCRAIQQIASAGYYYDLSRATQVGRALVDLQDTGRKLTAGKVILTEQLTGSLAFVPGSGHPAPVVEGSKLTFSWTDVTPGSTITATYSVAPGALGPAALRAAGSGATVVDSLLRVSAPVTVPLRSVNVVPCAAPTPTATDLPPTSTATTTPPPPTATASPTASPEAPPTTTPTSVPPSATATAGPTATRTPEPGVAYLPMALARVCRPAERHSDVVLALDTSSSMLEPFGATTRLGAAQRAARRFIELMDLGPGADQAAIVAFNAEATIAAPLTDSRALLDGAIAVVATGQGTRIEAAIDLATTELAGPRRRSANQAVLILLSDGRPSGGTEPTLTAAAAAKATGVTILTVGLGDDVDGDLLRAVATTPSGYVAAPDAAALQAVYESLAADLPCPGGAGWSLSP